MSTAADLVQADPYLDFLRGKIKLAQPKGFEVELDEIHPVLWRHQPVIVQWAVRGGCRAIFASFGLGKTLIQAEILRQIHMRTGSPCLVVLPLGVRQEFKRDGLRLGMEFQFIQDHADMRAGQEFYLTNYESVREGKVDPRKFGASSLDEAAVLRSFGSNTYQTFLPLFAEVPFKFVGTAMPAPNRLKELIHYAGFLGIMDTGQALTRFFQRDSTQANNLTLYPHKEREFWLWVHSWACFISKPSDLGFSDDGYELPPLDVRFHEVPTNHALAGEEKDGQLRMFKDAALGLRDAAAEKRDSLAARVECMRGILAADPEDHFILWHDLEDERNAIAAAVPEAVAVYGSQGLDEREQAIIDFSDGKFRYLSAKPIIAGSGCNFQRHCNRAIFIGIGYKFHDFLQAIHRIYRFLQTREVRVDIIYSEAEREILKDLLAKWAQHNETVEKMTEIIKEHGLNSLSMQDVLARTIGVERIEVKGDRFEVANNDTVIEARRKPDASVDLIVSSIPFCYDEETQVLTRVGWKGFGQLDLGNDEIATVNRRGQLEYQRPSRVVWERYEGEMIEFSGRSFNLKVTPNHRMYASRRGDSASPDSFEIVAADAIAAEYERAKRKGESKGRILRGWRCCVVPPARGTGNRPERIEIPRLDPSIRTGHGVELYWIESKDFMRLAGWYLSEGHADCFDTTRSGGRLSIAQCPTVNAANYREIEDLMVRIGLPPSRGKNQVSVWCRNLAYFLRAEFGHGSKHKRIPRWVLELHPDLLEILRDTMMKGDGCKRGNSYASISPELRDNFQELCLKTGWRATLNGSKVIQVGSVQIFPEIRKTPIRSKYSGMIGCATVPNGTMVVRRNGQPSISGNSNHYEYTPSYNDFGHSENNAHFWEQMDFLTPELFRILQPGRAAAIHVKNRIVFGNVTGLGFPTEDNFLEETSAHFQKHGFKKLGIITVVTDVVRENNQTYRLGWSEQCKDGSKMGVGCPEYVVIFRKPQTDRSRGYGDVPVTKPKVGEGAYTRARWQVDAHAFWRSSGNRMLTPEEMAQLGPDQLAKAFTEFSLANIYDYEFHVRIGEELDRMGKLPSSFMSLAPGSHHPNVWHDINRMRTLNGDQSRKGLQFHVCPLQFDIVDRLINRYSNPGDLVYDPFGGLFTVPLRALKLGRRGAAVELNTQYFFDGVHYLKAEEMKAGMPDLFALAPAEDAQEAA
jgi:hypothetical protein